MIKEPNLDEFSYEALKQDIANNPDEYDKEVAVLILRHLNEFLDFDDLDKDMPIYTKFLYMLEDTYEEEEE